MLRAGTIIKNHCFTTTKPVGDRPLELKICKFYKASSIHNPEPLIVAKRGTAGAGRDKKIKTETRIPIEAPGLRDIKKVELVTKWTKFVPENRHDDVIPEVSEEVIEKIRREKRLEKTRKKKVVRNEKDNNKRGGGAPRWYGDSSPLSVQVF